MKYQFYILSFVGGFILMSIELTASRITAPIIGTSIYSWTSIIGVILLALSVGNFLGGLLADKSSDLKKTLSYILVGSGISIIAIPYLSKTVSLLLMNGFPLVTNILILSFSLFFIPSLLLGAIFPIILKFSVSSISSIGKASGTLSSLSALGSITGAFLTGFFFIGRIGSFKTLVILSFLLFSFGIFLYLSKKNLKNTLLLVLLVAIAISMLRSKGIINKKIIYQKESAYYNIRAINDPQFAGGSKILFLDEGTHSIEPINSTNLLAHYTRINTEIIKEFLENNQHKKILVIGGGSYSLPKHLKSKYPNAKIEVLEIDPEVQKTAEKLFGLDSDQIKTTIMDARLFFKNGGGNYDVIINDAYSATISVPWQLTTQEFIKDINNNLTENGLYIANLNSSLKENKDNFLKSYYKTTESVFPATYALKTNILLDDNFVQNVILVSFRSPTENQIKKFLGNFDIFILTTLQNLKNSVLLTDNFAPVERLMAPSINKYYKDYLENIYFRFLF